MTNSPSPKDLPRLSKDVAESAEGRTWLTLRVHAPISAGDLCALVDLTPQYTRKTLRGLEREGLSHLDEKTTPNTWAATGKVGVLIRYAKSRDVLAASRSRKALNIRIWRYLKRSAGPKTVVDIAKEFNLDAATVQTSVRQLKARQTVGSNGRDVATIGTRYFQLVALGSKTELVASLDLPEVRPTPQMRPTFPRVNSVWALGSAAV